MNITGETEDGKRGGLVLDPADLRDPPEPVCRNWGWLIAIGAVLILGGIVAAAMPVAASIAIEIAVGLVMLIGGIMEVVHAFRTEGWRARGWAILSGAVYLIGGGLLLLNPLVGLVALTLLIVAILTVDGAFRVALGVRMRPERGWGWMVAGGVTTLALAGLIFLLFPGISLTLLGILVAVSLIFEGWSFVFLGVAARRAAKAAERGGGGREQHA